MKSYALFPRTPGLFSSLNVQKNMLQDKQRAEKFKEAIFKSVAKGDVVIDLGTGTGVLAIWAAQAGAKKVYAIEETDVAEVAESIIKENGFEDVITVFKANSSQVELPELADILIAEVVGHFLFEEGIIEAIAGARDALLKPSARLIPSGARVFLAPVELNNDFNEISFWDTWNNPSLAPIRKEAANSAYVETIDKQNVLATPCNIFNIDFNRINPGSLKASTSFEFQRSGRLDGLVGWFELHLGEGICLSTSPWSEPTHWQQCVFPVEHPFYVCEGQGLAFTIEIEPFAPGCKWHWSIIRDKDQGNYEEHSFTITYAQDSRLLKERF